jgi:AbrB family looped-hinge helix DNA binding protein
MRVTSKGQVTIPVEIREKAGLLPNTEVDFEFDGTVVRIVPAKAPKGRDRGDVVARLRGKGRLKMTTDEIMALMRGRGDIMLSTDEIMKLTRGE